MTRVLLWKEIREQWMSAVAVVALGAGLFVSLVTLSDVSGVRYEHASAILFCMAWVCGLVAGVQPLAAEFEAGSLDWLDTLPVTRRQLWRAKTGAAAAVVGLQVVVFLVLIASLGVADPTAGPVELLIVALLCALWGLSCGLFGSAVANTSLAAFGWAIVAQCVASLILIVLAAPFADQVTRSGVATGIVVLLVLGLAAIPLVASARRFGRIDRLRQVGGLHQSVPGSAWKATAWLTWRQGRAVIVIVSIAGLLVAFFVPLVAPHLWPAFGMLLGVAAGVGTFGADQAGQARQFFGDRRLPPGRVWLTKQVVRFAAPAFVVVAYLLFTWLRIVIERERTAMGGYEPTIMRLKQLLDPSLVLFGPVFGYAIGQFFGLVSRKEAVAAVLAVLTAAGVCLAWLPSLVIGGVHWWQWLLPPFLLVVATRFAIWPWACGRLATWRPALGLVAVGLLATAGVAAGIGYRMIEAPVRSDPFDVAAFEASLPKPEQNEAGRAIGQLVREFHAEYWRLEDQGRQATESEPTPVPLSTIPRDALTAGEWPADSVRLDRWLDSALPDDLIERLRVAVKKPLGMVNLGGRSYQSFDWQLMNSGETLNTLILARALRRIAHGEFEPALDDITLALDLCRHLQNNANTPQFMSAARDEQVALELLPRWAVKVADRPDLLRRAIDMLRSHEAARPSLTDTIKLSYLMALDYLRDPTVVDQPGELERDLFRAAVQVPWEQFRERAILATQCAGYLRTAETSFADALKRIVIPARAEWSWALRTWTPPAGDEAAARRAAFRLGEMIRTSLGLMTPAYASNAIIGNAGVRTVLPATELQLALVLYQTENGQPAKSLNALVPKILPVVPTDPFGDGPYHYRVSAGEQIRWSRFGQGDSASREILPGEGVVWSIGPDLQDDGGHVNDPACWRFPGRAAGGDVIFVVPVVRRR